MSKTHKKIGLIDFELALVHNMSFDDFSATFKGKVGYDIKKTYKELDGGKNLKKEPKKKKKPESKDK